ncbi:MAG TPA: alpha/beta hydrolase-fold protein [Chitinophagaceae bacterium]|nr:alpha/beta hydrolase-fold protein [Chitinophagaceae bacterium]
MKGSGILVVFFLCAFVNAGSAQINVTFVLKQRPPLHTSDSIFIAGSFNTWNPSDNRYLILPGDPTTSSFNIRLNPGNYEYKFTRGAWNKVETNKDGKDVANRTLTITKDTVVQVEINGWRDDFKTAAVIRKHTASPQVSVLDSAFNIPQLNRTRRIWVYLPADYTTSNKRFPVLYMHDGQNLFDESTSGFGEWGVDECLDSLFAQGKKECIVIGIDNGARRMNEYNPYEFKPYGNGEGDKYVDFLANTLKPYIDKTFRTKSEKKNTFIAGSSMGGLISLYAVMKYPNVYGGAGIFSPAFWTAPGLENDVARSAKKIKSKLFFYAGGKEGDRMIPDMKKIEAEIKALSSSKIYERTDMEARHNEAAWRKYFPEFYNRILN